MLGLPHSEDQTLRIRKPRQECFNCLSIAHRVSECPVRIDQKRIDLHRNFFNFQNQQAQGQSQLYANRYTSDLDSNSYRGFRPGKVSDELREALGIEQNQLPPFIYIMRKLGYPTGWLIEAQVKDAKLAGLDEGLNKDLENEENGEKKAEPIEYDPEKIFSFPGFNEPLPTNLMDVSTYF
jgi:zinc finger CCHC domain-containing protein 8